MDGNFAATKEHITDLKSNEELELNEVGMISVTSGMEVFVDCSLFEIPKDSSFTIFGFIQPVSSNDEPVAIANNNMDKSFRNSCDFNRQAQDEQRSKNLQEMMKERFSGFIIQWLEKLENILK